MSTIHISRNKAKENRKKFDDALENIYREKEEKEEERLRKRYQTASNDHIVAVYFMEQYHSPR